MGSRVVVLGRGATRLLSRLAIDPSLRQIEIARSLNISRSAVNQIWKSLETTHNMRVAGNLDYGAIGYNYIFGWAIARSKSRYLAKLSDWLSSQPFTRSIYSSSMSMSQDSRILFEVLLPSGKPTNTFLQTLQRYEKEPYKLSIFYDFAEHIAHYLNMGFYEGGRWNFDSGFRFEAAIEASKNYLDIFPSMRTKRQSAPHPSIKETKIISASLESNYFVSSSDVSANMVRLGAAPPSNRTLRRRIKKVRQRIIQPYILIEGIGLDRTLIISLEESKESNMYNLLRAQLTNFPKIKAVLGAKSLFLLSNLPKTTDWMQISNAFANVANNETEMCTFIAEMRHEPRWLQDIL